MASRFIEDLNVVSKCRKYNIELWQCPNFLFIAMGVITIVAMFGTYFISESFYSEAVTIVSVSVVAALIFVIGGFIIRGVEKVTEANMLKSEFIAIISHQLASPLSVIKWNLEIVEDELCKLPGHEKCANFLENIKISNNQLLKLVGDLLEVIRIDQGRAVFNLENAKLGKLIEDAIGELEQAILAKKIVIEKNLMSEECDVSVDVKRIKIVLTNLIGNAIKYSLESGKVSLSTKMEGNKAIFSVEDHGVGIPKHQHAHVFDRFFRSSNKVRYQTEGVGLGLYLSKAIVESFGGKVWFESVPEQGSIFYFSLPIKK